MVLCAEDNSKWEEIQEARAEEKAEALQVEKHFEEASETEIVEKGGKDAAVSVR